MHMLEQDFIKISKKYTQDTPLILKLWQEIEEAHLGRAYHNLAHLQTMYKLLLEVKEDIDDWESLVYAIVYHDFVYDVLREDNEKRSALLAQERLKKLFVCPDKINKVFELIMATKSHSREMGGDCDFFVDVDLAIWALPFYEVYINAIRKEYAVYSDEVYKKGRERVIRYFLGKEKIYQSNIFFEKFERKARENLERELFL